MVESDVTSCLLKIPLYTSASFKGCSQHSSLRFALRLCNDCLARGQHYDFSMSSTTPWLRMPLTSPFGPSAANDSDVQAAAIKCRPALRLSPWKLPLLGPGPALLTFLLAAQGPNSLSLMPPALLST